MPLMNSKSVQITKNVIDILFRKWYLIFRFPSGIENLPIDPVFSKLGDFIQMYHKLLLKFKELLGHKFFLLN